MLGQETNCDNADLDLIFAQSNGICTNYRTLVGKRISGKPGFEPGASGSGSANANHCAMPLLGFKEFICLRMTRRYRCNMYTAYIDHKVGGSGCPIRF